MAIPRLINDKCKPFKTQRKMIYFTCQIYSIRTCSYFKPPFAVCASEYTYETRQRNHKRKPEATKKAGTWKQETERYYDIICVCNYMIDEVQARKNFPSTRTLESIHFIRMLYINEPSFSSSYLFYYSFSEYCVTAFG